MKRASVAFLACCAAAIAAAPVAARDNGGVSPCRLCPPPSNPARPICC